MRFEDIHLVTPDLIRSSAEDVTRAENQLGCLFPQGYAEYVQQLGDGTLNDLVHVWLPQRIVEWLPTGREIWDGFGDTWPWDDPESQASQDRVRESIALGETNAGDVYCFHPDDLDAVMIVPHDLDTTFTVEPGLGAALDWTFASGRLMTPEPIVEFHANVPIRNVSFDAIDTDLPAATDTVASVAGALTVQHSHPDAATIYFPAVKGLVRLHGTSAGDVSVLLKYQFDAPDDATEDLRSALSRAGFRYRTAW